MKCGVFALLVWVLAGSCSDESRDDEPQRLNLPFQEAVSSFEQLPPCTSDYHGVTILTMEQNLEYTCRAFSNDSRWVADPLRANQIVLTEHPWRSVCTQSLNDSSFAVWHVFLNDQVIEFYRYLATNDSCESLVLAQTIRLTYVLRDGVIDLNEIGDSFYLLFGLDSNARRLTLDGFLAEGVQFYDLQFLPYIES
ncbi:hypothetical protein [Pseudobacteriovorax antillogorgiicola]|uniref:Lipoprotein n=1 Tax=Pseudobacteriovorax antillogorgiicola TaxID=1513793 RepID=A0A1Y6C953_9BACT|nr:hypothetical protein [Pseudobacteriovorax antillogorgiicola]TCS49060.1 hypothetical protein EDD56_116103 [Pseudobacteriovorax antillogorgiicola]SMF52361.1 hypothetical protein SAMN06296036_11651 [Pseudobacteriovorax antillogorgiicola]